MVNAIDRNEGVAERPRHAGVHLGDHQIGRVDSCAHDVDRNADARVPVAIGRTHLKQRHVDADPS
jgi:hypothetical protein